MSADGFVGYDAWLTTEPAPERPDPPDAHEECDRRISELESEVEQLGREIGARDTRIEELELELKACREGHSQ